MKRLLAIFMTLCMVLGLSGVNVWAADEVKWQGETPISVGRQGFGSCVVGDKIYIMGGGNNSGLLDTVEIYDTKTKTWSTGTRMPEMRNYFTSSVINDKIYIVGGSLAETPFNQSVLIYNIKSDTWSTGKPISTGRRYFASSVVGDKIYVFGGAGTKALLNTVEIYDTKTDTWSDGTSMPEGIMGMIAEAVGDKIYIIGGTGPKGLTNTTVNIYDTKKGTWSTGASTEKARYDFSSVVIGDKIYAIGGMNLGNPQNSVQIYSTSTNTWTDGPKLNTPRYLQASETVNGKIYVVSGTNLSDNKVMFLNSMESLQVGTPQSNKLSVLLNVDETVQLSVSYNLADNAGLTWSSTNESVATVDKNGKVTAVGEGQADIYAQNADGTFKEYISVKVVPGTANGMRLAAHLKVGEKVKLHLFDDPSKVTWKSMDESIATVSATGQVTAAKKGLAIIQGELEGQTYQIYVRVNG